MLSKRSAISPLLTDPAFEQARQQLVDGAHDAEPALGVVVELNLRKGLPPALVAQSFDDVHRAVLGPDVAAARPAYPISGGYVRCLLRREEMSELLLRDAGTDADPGPRSIFRLWPDYVLWPRIDRSRATIKADAAGRTYEAAGANIVWAVLDTGIDARHPHFGAGTLSDPRVVELHRDFTWLVRREAPPAAPARDSALLDESGHGTHVAGIIAGRLQPGTVAAIATLRPATNDDQLPAEQWPQWQARRLAEGFELQGMAPRALLVSLKVLDGLSSPDSPRTTSSAVMAALAYVREVNANGRALQIHGLNLSLGCDWHPRDYAAGQSPLCREVNLAVATGVVAVVSAGNTGAASEEGGGGDLHGSYASITEPGHADRAITVGATHRDSPHSFGVWYRSAKGPTLDGRRKPDLVAPGESITSAASGRLRDAVPAEVWQAGPPGDPGPAQVALGGTQGVEQPSEAQGPAPGTTPPEPGDTGPAPAARPAGDQPESGQRAATRAHYAEESGTSMAAPHVSGAVAAFLSARPEFIGQPDLIKALFCETAVDLRRDERFQGHGLVDLMAALAKV